VQWPEEDEYWKEGRRKKWIDTRGVPGAEKARHQITWRKERKVTSLVLEEKRKKYRDPIDGGKKAESFDVGADGARAYPRLGTKSKGLFVDS